MAKKITTGAELAAAATNVAKNYKTLYIMGCFGAPMTTTNKERYCNNHSYNKKSERQAMIKKASADTFGFDCVCLIKGLLWGWEGNKSKVYGGATYKANNVPDIGADTMITQCKDISTDFTNIEIGEAVWRSGHIGIYIGNGLAVECTPQWDNCVQITACNKSKAGYHTRTWTKHGKLPYVTYPKTTTKPAAPTVTAPTSVTITLQQLSKGSQGEQVATLQALLMAKGYSVGKHGADGDFGTNTHNAVTKFQKANGLEVDGVVGKQTWNKLLKG